MNIEDNIEIARILDILKRKAVLILCILLLFGMVGVYYSFNLVTPKYKSSESLLLIPEGEEVTNADLTLNSELINTYSNIVKNPKILNKVINNLRLDITDQELLKKITVSTLTETYIIKIEVTDTDAKTGKIICEEIGKVFLEEIKEIYNLNNIGIVDSAEEAEAPYNINHIKDIIMFLFIGVVISAVMVFFIYMFKNTIKDEVDVQKFTKIKVLGSIPNCANKNEELAKNDSYTVECLNTIRTNVMYINSTKNLKTLLITSCLPEDGKTYTSSNIAASFANTNKKVLLIDADLRKGRLDKLFNVENNTGLADYIDVLSGKLDEDIEIGKKYIKETNKANLHILTNGKFVEKPSELIGSSKMKYLLDVLKNIYDVIIIDAPPCIPVSDSIILSTIVDSTILVAKSEKTKISDIKEVVKNIKM